MIARIKKNLMVFQKQTCILANRSECAFCLLGVNLILDCMFYLTKHNFDIF